MADDLIRSLAEHEAVIERGLNTFVEVGTALLAIREERLYRQDFATFEKYCRGRWSFGRQRAQQLIEAAAVVQDFGQEKVQPNESQARELGRVPEPERAEVWRETVERTNGKPTAAAVRETYAPTPPVIDPDVDLATPARREPMRPPISNEEIAQLRAVPTPAPRTPVTELLESNSDLQRARYLHEFMKVLTRSDDFMEFDPTKLAELADADLVQTVDDYAARVRNFTDRFHRARPGLHVISGGMK